jgi:hypothetical protein
MKGISILLGIRPEKNPANITTKEIEVKGWGEWKMYKNKVLQLDVIMNLEKYNVELVSEKMYRQLD